MRAECRPRHLRLLDIVRTGGVGAITLLATCGVTFGGEAEPVCAGLSPGPTRTVVRVVDGETLALDDGTELRLVGALAPRAIDVGAEPGAWPMEAAAAAALRSLVLGKSIEVRFGGERGDRYGRMQGHAWLLSDDQPRWLQGHLLELGWARAYTLPSNAACASELLAAESMARKAQLGLWATAAYQVRPAGQTAELLRQVATFQVVEGLIERVGEARGAIYLNFSPQGRRGFSVSLKRADRHRLGAFAGNPKGLTGRSARVRGWIEHREGPLIDLSAGGDLEVLDAAAAAEAKTRPPGR